MLPKIDVLLPFHTESILISESITSTFSSKNVSVRLILIDDRKSINEGFDPVSFVPDDYKESTIYVRSHGVGYGAALGVGSQYIESEYVALMNSDDLMDPDRLSLQVLKIIKTKADICVAKIQKFSSKGPLPSITGNIDVDNFNPIFLFLGPIGADATWVVRSEFWKRYVKYSSSAHGADWITALTLIPTAIFTGESKAIYKYRIHSEQSTQSPLKKSAFTYVYPFYLKAAEGFGLTTVNIETARALAAPWETINFDKFDLIEFNRFSREIIKLADDDLLKDLKNLIKRRETLLGLRKIRFIRNPKDILKVFWSYFINLKRHVKPRRG